MSVCLLLRDWVKGQVTAAECGATDFETAFLPFMLLPDGRRGDRGGMLRARVAGS